MAEALDAALDLVPLLLWGVAWGLAALLSVLVAVGKATFNPSIPLFGKPLNSAWNTIEGAVNSALNDAANGVAKAWSGLLNGLIDSIGLLIAFPALLFLGVKAALEYLWNSALSPLIAHAVNPVRTLAQKAEADAAAATRAASDAIGTAEHYAEGQAASALESAKAYALGRADALESTIVGLYGATVSDVQAAEHAIAVDAPRLPGMTWDDLEIALSGKDAGTLAGALGVGAIAASLVNVLATEAGLGSSDCRAKNKQICGVDTAAWTSLLEGLAVIGFAFSLADLAAVAQPLAGELAPVIAKAA